MWEKYPERALPADPLLAFKEARQSSLDLSFLGLATKTGSLTKWPGSFQLVTSPVLTSTFRIWNEAFFFPFFQRHFLSKALQKEECFHFIFRLEEAPHGGEIQSEQRRHAFIAFFTCCQKHVDAMVYPVRMQVLVSQGVEVSVVLAGVGEVDARELHGGLPQQGLLAHHHLAAALLGEVEYIHYMWSQLVTKRISHYKGNR